LVKIVQKFLNNKKRLDSPDLIHLRIDRHEVPSRLFIFTQKSLETINISGAPHSNSHALAAHHLRLKNSFPFFAPLRDSF